MPIAWGIAADLLWLESHGEVSFEEWHRTVDAAMAHTAYRPGMGVIHDWRKLCVAPGSGDLFHRAQYARRLLPSRWALIVEGTAQHGVGRIAETIAEIMGIQLRVFCDRTEAAAWAKESD